MDTDPPNEIIGTPKRKAVGNSKYNSKTNKKEDTSLLLESKDSNITHELSPKEKAKAQMIVNIIEAFMVVNPVAMLRYGWKVWRTGAEELVLTCGGEEQAKEFINRFAKFRDTTKSQFLAGIDTPGQLASRYASVKQEMERNKKDGYNIKGSGYKYQEPIVITNNKSK